ncbi:MAG: sugar phosphate isomerase/epimerase family protein [Bryobacteraceae bacterium]
MNRRDFFGTVAATGLTLAAPALPATGEKKGRFRPAICAYSFRDELKAGSMTYAELIRMAAAVGADGIDFTVYWLPDTNDQTLYPLKRLAYRSSVAIYTIGISANMAQPTPELRSAEVEKVKKWIPVAEKLGASHIRVFGGDVPKGATEDQAVVWAVETLKRCSEEAAKRGITLGVEDDGGLTTNADRTVEIVKKTDSQWAAINLDIGNFPDNGYSQIEMCAPYASNVHFKSEVHVNRSATPVDIPRVLKILGSAGYHGYLAIEYEAKGDPRTMVPKMVSMLRDAIHNA